MRPILASLLIALPAHAGDSAFWSGTGCQLVPVDGKAWVAEVHCRNVLTPWMRQPVAAEMQAGGITVDLSLLQTYQDEPDVFTITPQDGFVAVPPVMSLAEDAEGVALVYQWLGF